MNFTIEAICAGKAVPFRDDEASAIAKQPVAGPVPIGTLGIAGDEQADRVHHGGPDMAVHHYPRDHHAFWRDRIGDNASLDLPGAFGSNLAVTGLTEGDVGLGARFRLGTTLVEVCQPRQPCWKIEHRFGHKGMVKTIMRTGRCGWYYRVIEEGVAEAGEALVPVEAGNPDWSIARIFDSIWGPGADTVLMAQIVELPTLADGLRDKLRKRLG